MKNKGKIALLLVTTSILLNGCALDKGFNTNKKTSESKTTITMEDVEEYLEKREKKEKHKHKKNNKEEDAIYEKIADEVIAGYWGNGEQRKKALINAGYDYERVRAIVNRKIKEKEREKSVYTGVVGYVNENTQLYNTQLQPIATVDKYQKAFIYSDSYNNCVHVYILGVGEGYIYIPHLTQIPNTYVEVDISDQKLYMYKDGELVLNADVITGRKGYETDLGYTEVIEKYYNLKNEQTGTQSDYFIQFNNSYEGFNDADDWRKDNEFNNKEAYIYNGSNGSVNMKQRDMEILNYYTDIGTKVLIHK